MKRKNYRKPTMKVVKCEYENRLLADSLNANRSNYGDAQESEWN